MFLPITESSRSHRLSLRSVPRRRRRAVFSLNNAAQLGVAQGSDLAYDLVIDATPRHFRETPPAEIDLMLPLPGLSPVSGKTVVNATVVFCGFLEWMFVSEIAHATNIRRRARRLDVRVPTFG